MVEDVLVMDAKGSPVHGLPRSAFHIFDQNKAQAIKNFEEGSPEDAKAEQAPPLPPGAFSNNSYLYSSSLVSDVFLIDADALDATAQMFLLQQLKQSIDALPPGVQASIFCQTSARTVQMRGLTADHVDLYKGVAECIPRVPTNMQDPFTSGMQQLLTVASTLQPIPGRKNILWFSGPFPLVPIVNSDQVKATTPAYVNEIQAMHQMQDMLAAARISVFPMDPRGVILAGMPNVGVGNAPEQSQTPSAQLSRDTAVPLPTGTATSEEYDYMQQMADATGGASFHLNDLHQQINQAITLGQRSYTLSYSPAGYTTDNSWHEIRVTVDGPYRISYRRGYLAVWTGTTSGGPSRLLTAGARAQPVTVGASQADKPLLFTVQVTPTAVPGPTTISDAPSSHRSNDRVTVAVEIPIKQLGFVHDGGKWQSSATVAAYAYDDYGKLKGGEQQQLDSALGEEQWQTAQASQVATHQSFVLPHSAKYVLFVVTDKSSRRQGTLMLPARVLRPNS